MKKKVGIITVHRAVNFGAKLQMFALYNILERLDAEVYIIDYKAKVIERREQYLQSIFHLSNKGILRNMFEVLDNIVSLPGRYKKKRKFDSFLYDNFMLSQECNEKNIMNIEMEYDYFIAGSDQIWNRELIDDDNYYLPFVHSEWKGKYSYAASFGTFKGFSEKKTDTINLLKDFNAISVREDIGVDILEKELGKKIYTHIDPAFLLNKDEWTKIAKIPRQTRNKHKYILLYWASRKLKKFASKLAKENGWKIYDIREGLPRGMIKNIPALSPEEFVGIFEKAEFVCTTSYHGMIFSILFHKPFKVDFDMGTDRENRRQLMVLDKLDMLDFNIQVEENMRSNMNWSNVDKILEQERQKSIDYFKIILRN